jgi:hypothetical protein
MVMEVDPLDGIKNRRRAAYAPAKLAIKGRTPNAALTLR